MKKSTARIERFFNSADKSSRSHMDMLQDLREVMTEYCGLMRTGEKLSIGLEKVERFEETWKEVGITDQGRVFNSDLIYALETENMLALSEAIFHCALARTETRGAHFRTDYPKRDNKNWLRHSIIYKDNGGPPKILYRDVELDQSKYPPA